MRTGDFPPDGCRGPQRARQLLKNDDGCEVKKKEIAALILIAEQRFGKSLVNHSLLTQLPEKEKDTFGTIRKPIGNRALNGDDLICRIRAGRSRVKQSFASNSPK